MLYYGTQDNAQELYEKEASWQIKRLLSSIRINRDDTGRRLFEYLSIYIDVWDDEDMVVRNSFLEIIEYLTDGEVQLGGITALTLQPEKNNFYCRAYKSWLFKVGKYLFVVWSKNPVDEYYYRKIYHDISVPCMELALLELFQERNFREISANRLVELIAERLDKIDLNIIWEVGLEYVFHYDDAEPYYSFMRLYNVLKGEVPEDESLVDNNKYLQLYYEGNEIDNQRLDMFQKLHDALLNFDFTTHKSFKCLDKSQIFNFSFWDSFYSNRIEGNRVSLERAQYLMKTSNVWSWNFEQVSSPLSVDAVWSEVRRLCQNPDEYIFINAFAYMEIAYPYYADIVSDVDIQDETKFIKFIRSIHKKLMEGVWRNKPGKFKDVLNRAGSKIFVSPQKVEGTLRMAHYLARDLNLIQKALFFQAVIVEVHPFLDGNGRTARIMMNILLAMAWEHPILVTSKWADYYLKAVKDFSIFWEMSGYYQRLDVLHTMTCEQDFSTSFEESSMNEFLMTYEELVAQQWGASVFLNLD